MQFFAGGRNALSGPIPADEWAYRRAYSSNAERLADLPVFLSEYNHARPHGGIGGVVPASRL